MKKIIKRVVAALLAATLVMALCGCGAQMADVTVEKDGSGTITAFVGSTREALEEFAAYSGEEAGALDLDGWDQLQYGGHTYYGRRMEKAFATPQDLSMEFVSSSQSDDGVLGFEGREALDFGDIQLERLSDGNMLLLLTIAEAGRTQDTEVDPDLQAIMEKHKDSMAQVLSFRFPGEVQQSGGCFNGIEVDGEKLTLDYVKMASNNCQTYSFRITIPKTESGWWAEKALASCLDNGWLTDRGPVNRENYDTTIRRQEAIAAMQRASQRPPMEGNNYTLADIPDYENICEKYRADLVAAYNSGITAGVDSEGTMLPLNTLTRAEACQLFYALRWGAPAETKALAILDDGVFMKVGSRVALTLALPDGVTDSMVVWASNAPGVATVSRGVVTAVSEGVAAISAAVGTETVSCLVSVEK